VRVSICMLSAADEHCCCAGLTPSGSLHCDAFLLFALFLCLRADCTFFHCWWDWIDTAGADSLARFFLSPTRWFRLSHLAGGLHVEIVSGASGRISLRLRLLLSHVMLPLILSHSSDCTTLLCQRTYVTCWSTLLAGRRVLLGLLAHSSDCSTLLLLQT